jgi:GNAT superfamily N-acetyltransferase
MYIRAAEDRDGAAIAHLLAVLGYPVTDALVASRLQQLVVHADAEVLVAVKADQVLGFIALHFIPQLALPGDFCRISYFCVDESVQGQGIGTALETAALALAQERGCDRLEVHCHSRRELAHRFYERQGYTESPKYWVKGLSA